MEPDGGLFAHDRAADAEIRKHLAGGPEVLKRLLSVLSTSHSPHFGLEEVVARSSYPAALPQLAQHVTGHEPPGLTGSAARALARSGDQQMLELLARRVLDSGMSPVHRASIAKSLGGTTHVVAREALHEVIDQEASSPTDEEAPWLLVAAVVALAKSGDQRRSALLLDLAGSEHFMARLLAIEGMSVALPAGMLACLRDAAGDPDHEIRYAANRALRLLGTGVSCELLMQMAESDHHTALDSCVSLGSIVGVTVKEPDDLDEVRDRWLTLRPGMRDDLCYRSGAPLDARALLDELMRTRSPATRDALAEEIEIRSGLDVRGALLFQDMRGLADSLAGLAMEPGGTYRWGHRQQTPTG